MWFTRVSIANPVFTTMVMCAFVVLGLFSLKQLRVEQFPDISFPVVVISTEYPGASPSVVESDLTRPVEEQVNTINGLKNLISRSYEGRSVIIAEFDLSIEPIQAAQDVREKVASIRSTLRKEIKEPRISRFDPADRPIFSLAIEGSKDYQGRTLTTYAEQVIKKRLENVRGVGAITLVGRVQRQVSIHINPVAMEARAIGVETVLSALRNETQDLPAGNLRGNLREQTVQIKGRLEDVRDFQNIIVARRGGQPVFLKDIARIEDGQEEIESLALENGKRVLTVDVQKAQGQNTIDVVDGLIRTIDKLKAELPPEIKLSVIKDGSRAIRISVRNVTRTLFEGAILTILIVFLFLNSWRSTIITGLTLPIALIGTFWIMYSLGFTINVLTLMALSLCVGLLIDDAIVVRENIVRHTALGLGHREAALEGTREIGLAVLATTLSIVAVFLPVGFMGGIIGRFFHQFGLTVVAAVLISMFVSFTLDPMLSSIWADPSADGNNKSLITRLLRPFNWMVEQISLFYQRCLAWSLLHRVITLIATAFIFLSSFALFPYIGAEFVPQPDNSEMLVNFNTPVGSSLEQTEQRAILVDKALREFKEVQYTYMTINTGIVLGSNNVSVYLRLLNRDQRTLNQQALSPLMRERLRQIGGIEVSHVGSQNSVNSSSKQLSISLQGKDQRVLSRFNREIQERFKSIPGLVDVDSSDKPAKPSLDIVTKRELASDLGIGIGQIGQALRVLIAGESTGTWRAPDGENYEIVLRLPPDQRDNADDLGRLMVATGQILPDGSPRLVPVRQIANINPVEGTSQINRRDLSREIEITGNVQNRSEGEVSADIRKVLATIVFPPGYRAVIGGSTRDREESVGYAMSALLLAIIFIYMVLASQFGSFIQPIAIMMSLPLTLIGVFSALLIFRSTLNLFSIIGFIMLMGLVTKNAILLVDFINQSRAQGMERGLAILTAARVRLRPIMMTTLAMIFGMLPLALGLGEGSEQRAPMGQAVIGGVITSSILTLVVVPVIYSVFDDWINRFRSSPKPH